MRKLAILTFLSLDGVMQAPAQAEEDLSGNFQHGGWAMPWWEEVMEQVQQEAMADPYDFLMGRKTYDLFAPHWSAMEEGDHAKTLNSARKYVATKTDKSLEWNNSTPITGDIATEVAKLKEMKGPLIQVHGSWQLIQTLLAHDLIDEFRLWTFPLTLGSGKRLFADSVGPTGLSLIKTAATPGGVIMGIYERRR